MSRLSDILGVKDGQEFEYEGSRYRVVENIREIYNKNFERWYEKYDEQNLCEMIAHPELIKIVPEKITLTEQQITAIKGRIAEGTPWAARDKDSENTIYFFPNKPITNSAKTSWHAIERADIEFVTVGTNKNNIYDFITFENSPIYLPDLIKE